MDTLPDRQGPIDELSADHGNDPCTLLEGASMVVFNLVTEDMYFDLGKRGEKDLDPCSSSAWLC